MHQSTNRGIIPYLPNAVKNFKIIQHLAIHELVAVLLLLFIPNGSCLATIQKPTIYIYINIHLHMMSSYPLGEQSKINLNL